MEYRYCHLRFFERELSIDSDDPSKYLQEWSGEIGWDDFGAAPRVVVGSFSLMFADLPGALTDGVSDFDVFDTRASSLEFYEALFDTRTRELRRSVVDAVFEPFQVDLIGGVLMIERLVLLPQHRGRGIGLLAMRCLIEQFRAAAGLVAIKVFPLQFEGSPPDDEPGGIRRADLAIASLPRVGATEKLKRHYERLGFASVGRSRFMVLDPTGKLPTVDQLMAPE